MTRCLSGAKVLFVGPVTYDYHRAITRAFGLHGAEVDFFGEHTLSLLYRLLDNAAPRFLAKKKEGFRRAILGRAKQVRYQFILVIRGDMLDGNTLAALRALQPGAHFVMYQWDAVASFDYLSLSKEFDRVWSFDRRDCEKFGFEYLPLFYDDDYRALGASATAPDLDLVFVGALHSDRLRVARSLTEQAATLGLTSFVYLYIPFWTYVKRAAKARALSHDPRFIRFRPLPKQRNLEYLARARVVVDVNNPLQSGLTMRTMEALGAGKKLITTNASIAEDEFYSPQQISIVERQAPKLDWTFVAAPTVTADVGRYHLTRWVEEVVTA